MPRRPTILQIIPELETGGAEMSTLEIAEAVVAAGGRALVLSQGGRMVPAIEKVGGTFLPFPAKTKNPVSILANARKLLQILKAEQVDLVHARSRAPAWSARLAARRAGLPFVTTFHGIYSDKGPLKRRYNGVMAEGDVVIANSHFTAREVLARYPEAAPRLVTIHRGVDMRRFDPALVDPARVQRLRSAWGVPEGAPVILHAARLSPIKGQANVIAAAGQLSRSGALGSAHIVFAGDDQGRAGYRAELEQAIASAGLAGRAHLPGHTADMPAAYLAAHVALLVSPRPEAFGRTSAEAQAMGCPVVVSNLGGQPETVRAVSEVGDAAASGWIVPAEDPAALAGALATALTLDPNRRGRMGENARTHVLANFTLQKMARATLQVYDRLLGSALEAAYVAHDPQPGAEAGL